MKKAVIILFFFLGSNNVISQEMKFDSSHFKGIFSSILSDSLMLQYKYRQYYKFGIPFFHLGDNKEIRNIDSNYMAYISYKSKDKIQVIVDDTTIISKGAYTGGTKANTIAFPMIFVTHVTTLRIDTSYVEMRVVVEDSTDNIVHLFCYQYRVVRDSLQQYKATLLFRYNVSFIEKYNLELLWTFGLPEIEKSPRTLTKKQIRKRQKQIKRHKKKMLGRKPSNFRQLLSSGCLSCFG